MSRASLRAGPWRLGLAGFVMIATSALGGTTVDWPQWRGPTRDGVAPPQKWSWEWPKEGPRKVWSANIGLGYASPIVSAGRVFAFGRVSRPVPGKNWSEVYGDCVTALDTETGTVLWQVKARADKGGEGVSSTPCTDGERLYAASWDGEVTALDVKTGAVVWQVNICKEYKTSKGGFHGIANSPLIAGDALVLAQGVALEKRTGKLLWQNQTAMSSQHPSPVLCNVGNQSGVVFAARSLLRLDPMTGNPLWQFDLGKRQPVYIDPVVIGDQILSIEGAGGMKFSYTADSVQQVKEGIFNGGYGYFGAGDCANPVVWQGYLYAARHADGDRSGLLGDNPDLTRSSVACYDLKTLKSVWRKSGMAVTPIVCDGKLILQGLYGEVRVAEASPDGYKELANVKVFDWTRAGRGALGQGSFSTPVLLDGRLYCREYHGELVCLDVSTNHPDAKAPDAARRIVGEAYTLTGTISARADASDKSVVGLLKESPISGVEPHVYELCAVHHNDNPGFPKKAADLAATGSRVVVEGTLLNTNHNQFAITAIKAAEGVTDAPK